MPHSDPEVRREYHRAYNKKWDLENRQRRLEIGREHDRRRYSSPERIKQRKEAIRRRHIRQRVTVIERYGGKCSFCGSAQFEHLTVDHINGDGKAHRSEFAPKYRNIYDFLERTGEYRPDLYRLLCWNCHMAMTQYGVQPGGESLRGMDYWEKFGALRRSPNGTTV